MQELTGFNDLQRLCGLKSEISLDFTLEQHKTLNHTTMQEHQTITTNATVSKDSDKISISVIMAV